MWLISALLLAFALVASIARSRRRVTLDAERPSPCDEKQDNLPTETRAGPAKLIQSSSSELPETITRSVEDHIDRGAWVLRLSHHVFAERHQSRYNVVVINNELEYHFNLKGTVERFVVKFYQNTLPKVVPYEVVVFKEGTLVNMGDGGDINWDWMGNFVRNGTKLLVFKPCVAGIAYNQDPWVAS
ncbi:hypothetical protein MMC28_008530 [Mycoblastus sanguinarius]|nr:hypothetical protein [Mycoblastus sanguinarius]